MSKKKKKKGTPQDNQNRKKPENAGEDSRTERHGRFWPIVAAISMVLNLALVYYGYEQKEIATDYDILLSDYMVKAEDNELRLSDCNNNVNRMENLLKTTKYGPHEEGDSNFVDSFDVLRESGITNPENFIKTDIMKQVKELIPFKPAQNKKMRIISRDAITILSPHLVFVRFTDGVTDGHMILEYKISGANKLNWSVAKAYKD